MIIKRASAKEVKEFCGDNPSPRTYSWIAIENGKRIAIWGLAYEGGVWYCFCDLEKEALRHKIKIMKQAKRLMAFTKRAGIKTVYVVADLSKPKSISWIHSLGFKHYQGTVFKWQH